MSTGNTDHQLSAADRDRIYSDSIAPRFLANSNAVEQPRAIITGGQPGSGKSRLADAGMAELEQSGGAVMIDADRLRRYHPRNDALMRADDKQSANLTHKDAGAWAGRLIADGVERRRNLVIDQTSRDAEAVERLAAQLHERGYKVELRAMAVKDIVSEQRILMRYERQKSTDGHGRYSTKDNHDSAYAGLANTIATVEAKGTVDALSLYDATHAPIYSNQCVDGKWLHPAGAAAAMKRERERSFTAGEQAAYETGLNRIEAMLQQPSRAAQPNELALVEGLRERATHGAPQPDRQEYKLSERENERIFQEDIKPYLIATAVGELQRQDEPTMVMVGGQPGAGKSRSMDSVKTDLEKAGGVMEIAADDLRKFHPLNDELMRKDDRTAANFTHADASLWAEKAERFAREQNFNVLLEGTMKTPENTAAKLSEYRQAGYFVEARVIATPERTSWQGVLARYEQQKADSGAGRMTPKEIHDSAAVGVLDTVERIQRDGLADRIRVDRRGADQIYSATLKRDGTWEAAQPEANARRAIEAERNAPWTAKQWDAHIAGYDRIDALLHRHGRKATAQDFQQITNLRATAVAARDQVLRQVVKAPESAVPRPQPQQER